MADYVMLRKGRNVLSAIVHAILNVALAVTSTAVTVISGSWILGVLLVLLSKWRVVAVRPRYWWLNIKANLVDYIVGISMVLLVYIAGTSMLNAWHIVLTIIYVIWLVIIKPRSSEKANELQSIFAVFFGTFATAIMADSLNDPLVSTILCFIIGYGASRHILMQGEDHDYTLSTFIFGLLFAEIAWVLYHWTITYSLNLGSINFIIPQLPIAVSLLFFVFMRGYKSAVRHDGKIRTDDILLPIIFSALLMFVMVFFFSTAKFYI